jgi:hypothetical protein
MPAPFLFAANAEPATGVAQVDDVNSSRACCSWISGSLAPIYLASALPNLRDSVQTGRVTFAGQRSPVSFPKGGWTSIERRNRPVMRGHAA